MKKLLFATSTLVVIAVAHPARAADQPLKAAPEATVPAAPWSWSGIYIGGHAGYGWGHDPFNQFASKFATGAGSPTLNGIESRGFLGGFQAGANWQRGAWVGGVEVDLSGADVKGATSVSTLLQPGGGVSNLVSGAQSDKFTLIGSARARLGTLVVPDVLLYGTGGLAFTQLDQTRLQSTSVSVLGVPFSEVTTNTAGPLWLFGWVAGVGVETRLAQSNWLARIEYLHYDFGDFGGRSDTAISSGVVTSSAQTFGHPTVDVVRMGLSYKFGGPLAFGDAPAAPAALPVVLKAPARPVAAAADWSGFYLGAHAGYGWGHDPFTAPIELATLTDVNSRGGLGGLQAGAVWQGRSGLVGGLEIDFSATNIKGATSAAATAGISASQVTQTDKFDWLGSARARLGYAVMPDLLLYGTGGLAWTRLAPTQDETDMSGVNSGVSTITTPTWRFGWVAGIGAEARLAGSPWLARLEYLHYDFGDFGSSSSVTTTNGVVTASSASTFGHLTADVVRAGLSYQLGGAYAASASPAPMFTKALAARPAASDWTGFYLGAHAGYGWGRDPISTQTSPPPFALAGDVNSRGGLGGFQAGADWQMGRLVAGLELDLSATGIKGTLAQTTSSASGGVTNTVTGSQTDDFKLLASTRVRLGYLVWPDTLLYATGGPASTQVSTIDPTQQVSVGASTTVTTISNAATAWRFGWVAGVGGEQRLAGSNWFGRLEYLHYDFGVSGSAITTVRFPPAQLLTTTTTPGRLTADVVRAGLSYKFE